MVRSVVHGYTSTPELEAVAVSRDDLSHPQVLVGLMLPDSRFRRYADCPTYRVSILIGRFLNAGCIVLWAGGPRPGRADLARVTRLTSVGKSAGHQLASPTDLPTKVS